MSIKKAAQAVIHKGVVSEGLLNRVEMAFRPYDPCFGCATHALDGSEHIRVEVRDAGGELVGVY
jgi:F420-non-reducing hydrogenase large subunit